MATSYLKEKSTGKILTSTSEQDSNNPAHTEVLNTFVTSRGWSLDDYEVGFADDDVVKEWLDTQDEANKTYADKRKAEYPTIEECVHAILDGELDALQAKRKIVKERHPKGGN